MSQRTQSTLILTAVFAIGLVAGVGAMIWAWPAIQARFVKPNPARRDPRTEMIDHMRSTLKLNDQQEAELKAVVDDTYQKRTALDAEYAPKFNHILAPVCDEYNRVRVEEIQQFAPIQSDAQEKLHAILTPEQWTKYQAQQAQIQKNRNVGPQGVRVPDLCHQHSGPPAGGADQRH